MSDGPDTALARLLHARGAVDLDTLRGALDEVRAARARDPRATLAQVLRTRRAVDPAVLAEAEAVAARGLDRLGPYRVLRLLAQGGMGAVFEVAHTATGVRYALKTMLASGLLTDTAGAVELERFRAEATLLARLDHPRVVRVHAADLDGGVPYLVQDLLPGGSLQARLERQGPLPVEEAVELTCQLAEGLAHAHERGVLHRDLKPHNVLLDERGAPRLADFGLALQLDARSRLTHTGELLGTPGYLAPEQASGERRTDVRTDVYGLGALLFALLTGGPPFEGRGLPGLAAVIEKPPPRPSARRPEVPAWLDAVVLRALAKEPGDRHQTVQELAAALRAGPATARARRRARRRIAAALLVAVAAVTAGAVRAQRLAAQRAAVREACAELAEDPGSLATLGARVAPLRERAAALGAEPRVRAALEALAGLAALAEGDLGAAAHGLRSASPPLTEDAPLVLALRGGIAALTTDVEPSVALADLDRVRLRVPELYRWRAEARGRAGLSSPEAAGRVLDDVEASAGALAGEPPPALIGLQAEALLALGRVDEALRAVAGRSVPSDLAWRIGLECSRRLLVAAGRGELVDPSVPLQKLGLVGPAPPSPALERWVAAVRRAVAVALSDRPAVVREWSPPLAKLEQLGLCVEGLVLVRPPRGLLGDTWQELSEFYTDVVVAGTVRRRDGRLHNAYFHGASRLSDVAPDDYGLQAELVIVAESGFAKGAFEQVAQRAADLAPTPDERLALLLARCTMLARWSDSSEETLALTEEVTRLLAQRPDGWRPTGRYGGRLIGFGNPWLWVHDARAGVLERLGRLDEAVAAYDAAGVLVSPPGDKWYRLLVARIDVRLRLGRYQEAVDLVEQGYAQGPSDYSQMDRINLAGRLWELVEGRGRGADVERSPLFAPARVAEELARALTAREGVQPRWWLRLAHLQVRLGALARAVESLATGARFLRGSERADFRALAELTEAARLRLAQEGAEALPELDRLLATSEALPTYAYGD